MMPKTSFSRLIRNSITLKISLAILVIETVLLCLMGVYYYNSFSSEIDDRVAEKMAIPGTLMSQLALNFEAVSDLPAMEDLIQEHVVDAFIVRKDGQVFYSADPSRIGKPHTAFIDSRETLRVSGTISEDQIARFAGDNDEHFLSILSPLEINDSLLGFLYIKIRADQIEDRKKRIIHIFLAGSLLTIFLTTLIEAFWVHHLFVPRLIRTVAVLKEVKAGRLSTRTGDEGTPDHIGILMLNVDSMIEQIENYTRNLEALTRAGEELAAAANQEDICRIVGTIIRRRFGTEPESRCSIDDAGDAGPGALCPELAGLNPLERKIVASGELLYRPGGPPGPAPSSPEGGGQGKHLIFMPVTSHGGNRETLCFVVPPGQKGPESSNEIFTRTLNRLMTDALERTKALGQLSQAEKKYRDLFSNASEGIFITTVSGKIKDVNPSLAAMFGYSSPETMMAGIKDLAEQGYAMASDRKAILEKVDLEERIQDMEVQLRRKDGSVFWSSMSAHAVRESGGKMVGMEGRITDVSERRRAEEAEGRRKVAEASHQAKTEMLSVLEEKNRELEETLKKLRTTQARLLQSEKMAAIGTMAGGVAHDLNNILSGVVSYPDLLLLQLPPESGLRESLEVIRDSGTRAAAVVSDLLTLARGVAYNKVIFNINNLVEKYLQSAEFKELTSRYPRVQVKTRLQTDPRHTTCSPVHILKVIMNLVTNAVEAVHDEGTVILSTENRNVEASDIAARSVAPGEYVVLKVDDTGPGIPDEDLDRVFEPFYSKKILGRSGTGLGLAVVWNTAREHHGTVLAESGDGGASISLYLPAAGEKPEESETEPLTVASLQGSGTILVVDDEYQQRDIATRMLTTLGYSVSTASTGEEAIARLREKPVDLVFLDMLMPPGLNGYETYREIVKIHPEQRAVICSGYSESDDWKRARAMGIGGFLRKPFTLETIGSIVKKEMERTG
jgi:PAS domain S-box-containing protein